MVAAFSPNVPLDHGGDVFLLTTSTRHMAQNAQPLAVREPSLYSWYYLNGPFYVYSQDQDPQRPFFRPIRLRRRLRSGFLPVVHHPQRPGAHGAIWRGHDYLRNTNPIAILGRLWRIAPLTEFHRCPFERSVLAQRASDHVTSSLDVHRPLLGHVTRCPPRPRHLDAVQRALLQHLAPAPER